MSFVAFDGFNSLNQKLTRWKESLVTSVDQLDMDINAKKVDLLFMSSKLMILKVD